MAELDWIEYDVLSGKDAIPHHTHTALMHYFMHGFCPGSFLTAMLVGDLFGAAFKADHLNKVAMGNIACWIVHHAPYNSYGTAAIVDAWCENNNNVRADFEKQVMWHKLNTAHVPKAYDF